MSEEAHLEQVYRRHLSDTQVETLWIDGTAQSLHVENAQRNK